MAAIATLSAGKMSESCRPTKSLIADSVVAKTDGGEAKCTGSKAMTGVNTAGPVDVSARAGAKNPTFGVGSIAPDDWLVKVIGKDSGASVPGGVKLVGCPSRCGDEANSPCRQGGGDRTLARTFFVAFLG